MDNTEKLIRAWLKCEGYEIEETVIKKPFNTGMGNPEIIETIKLIDYKVTKKEADQKWFETVVTKQRANGIKSHGDMLQKATESFSMAELIAHSDAWSAICDYTLTHKEDIESGINDFETLKPVWDFFNRNTEPFTLEDIKHDFGEIDENIRYGNL